MTVYDYATEPDQAKQLQQAWQEGYECACSDMERLLRESMNGVTKLTDRTRSTWPLRYFEGWRDAMLEAVLVVSELEERKGESCEQS